MSTTKLSAFCSKVIEAGWIAAVLVVPLYFNIWSSRVFEPDKLTLMRSIALVMAAAWIVKWIDEMGGGKNPLRTSWRTPIVLPALALAVVYLFSTLTAVKPLVSFWGSYQRLQGTYTTLSYIVIFLLIVNEMRTREQFDRLITSVIVGSVPIAIYGMIQHYGFDPLPWGGDVTRRVASNMGNAIFVAGYLMMVFFLTAGRIIESTIALLTEEEPQMADMFRASAYIFVAFIHLIAIYFTQSRGPWVGLASGIFIMVFLGLLGLRHTSADKGSLTLADVLRALAAQLGMALAGAVLGLVLVLAGQAIGAIKGIESGELVKAGLSIGSAVLGASLVLGLISLRKTWKWLWLSWLLVAIWGIGFFAQINIKSSPLGFVQDLPYIGRLGKVFDLTGGTGKVRVLIWEGAVDMVTPHEPIQYPAKEPGDPFISDTFNVLRPLIGYGPESMYVAYNPFYPSELAHFEKRNASPDRSHNDTFDSLVITGLIGLIAYMGVFGSAFYYGFKWLGWINTPRDRNVWLAFWLGGGLIAALVFVLWQGAAFFGVGLPIGMLVSLVLYLAFYKSEAVTFDPQRFVVLLALLSAIIAHFMETQFGFGIAATRTHFFAYLGLLVVFGARLLDQADPELDAALAEATKEKGIDAAALAKETQNVSSRKRRRKTRRSQSTPKSQQRGTNIPDWLGPVLAFTFVLVLILGTMGFDFTFMPNTIRPDADCDPSNLRMMQGCWSSKAWEIVNYDLTTLPARGSKRPEDVSSPMALGMFAITFAIGVVITVSEAKRRGIFKKRPDDWGPAAVLLVSLAFTLVLFTLLSVADRHLQFQRLQQGLSSEPLLQEGEDCDQICQVERAIGRVLHLSDYMADLLVVFYAFVFSVMFLIALSLLIKRRLPNIWARPWGGVALVLVVFVVMYLVYQTNIKIIQADILYKQGDSMTSRKDWDLAIAHYKRALKLAPNEDYYYLWLGSAFLQKASSAQAGYQILDDDDISTVLNLSAGKTMQLSQSDLMASARAALKAARKGAPFNTDHTANLGRLYKNWADMSSGQEKQERLEKSIAYYLEAITLSPRNTIVWNEYATIYLYQLDDVERGREILSQSLALDDQYDKTYMLFGDSYSREAESLRAAISKKSQELQTAQGDAKSAIEAELSELQTERQEVVESAIEYYWQALEIAPKTTRIYLVIASLYEQIGRLDQVVETYQAGVDAKPTATDVYQAWAQFYYRQGEYDKTIATYHQLIEVKPTTAKYRLELVGVLNQLGRADEALGEIQRAAQEIPKDGSIRRTLAQTYQQMEMFAEALQEAQAAVQLNPQDEIAYLLIGDLSRQLSQFEQALQAYEQALTIDPDMSRAWIVYQNVALIYQNLGQLDKALQAATSARDLAPEDNKASLEQLITQLEQAGDNSP